jgi:hypothetical protein
MNANEIADELSACFTKADWEYVDETVNILRQFGLAESIIKQQKLEIEALKDKLYLAKQSLDIVDGWIGKAQEK